MDNPGMTFDSSPVTQDTPIPASGAGAAAGMTFDSSPTQQAITVPPVNGQQPQSDEIQSNAGDSLLATGAKAIGGAFEGLGEGMFGTAAGASDIADKMTGQAPGAVNKFLHTEAGDGDDAHGTAQNVGRGLESIIEFAMGDEALKGLSLSEKLAQSSKLAKMLEGSPRIARLLGNALDGAARGGIVGGVQGGIKSGGTVQGAAEGALAGGVGGAVAGGLSGDVDTGFGSPVNAVKNVADTVGDAPEAVGNAIKDTRIAPGDATPVQTVADEAAAKSGLSAGVDAGDDFQEPLQQGIRDIASGAANNAGVDVTPSDDIRDAVPSIARGVYGASKSDYALLDQASGGRWQRYSDAIKQINDRLGNLIEGVDDDSISNLEQRRNEVQASQAQMIEDLKEGGKIDPEIADRAAGRYKQAMALQDLGNAVKASTKLVPAGDQVQQVVNPDMLANRLAKLNDTSVYGGDSRLVQALGQDGADKLIGHVSQAQIGKVAGMTPTGQKALSNLLQQSASGGITAQAKQALGFKPSMNYLKAYGKFNAMAPTDQAAQFGDEASVAKQFLAVQAKKQLFGLVAKGAGIATIAKVTGLSHTLLHMLLD